MAISWPKTMEYTFWKIFFFLYFFKVHYCCLKSILLYPEYQINDVSLLDMPKTRHSKKWPFLAKNYGLTPLENFDFLEFFFFETLLFLSKQNSFLSRTSENNVSWLDLPKNLKYEK